MTPAAPAGLCIIAGSGRVPVEVAVNARSAGRPVFVAALKGFASPADYPGFDLAEFGIAQLGGLLRAVRERGITEVCMIGGVVRPAFADLKPDFGVIRYLPTLAGVFRKGDDGLLGGVIRILEGEGLTVRAASEFLSKQPVAGSGGMTRIEAPPDARAEIAHGLKLLDALSPFDVGQAVVIIDGRVVAIEGVEGTDGLLVRVATMRSEGRLTGTRGGVLVKAPKTGQSMLVDAPTIGPQTLRSVQSAGLAGIGVTAGVMIAERDRTIALANELELFIEVAG